MTNGTEALHEEIARLKHERDHTLRAWHESVEVQNSLKMQIYQLYQRLSNWPMRIIAKIKSIYNGDNQRFVLNTDELISSMTVSIQRAIDLKIQNKSSPIYFPNGRVLIHTVDNQRLYLDMREPFMALHLIEHREWETHVRTLMRRFLFDGAIFVDVGANIGVHTLFAAALVGEKGVVHAIEPHPYTGELLRSNLEINGFLEKVKLHGCAAGDEILNEISFEYFPEHPGMSGFTVSGLRKSMFNGTVERIKVPCVTLDSLLEEVNYRADLVKIDVEGFELKVLQGSKALIENNQNVCFLIEFESSLIKDTMGESAIKDTLNFFASRGFDGFVVSHEIELIPFHPDAKLPSSCDLFFARPGSKHYTVVATYN